MTVLAIVPPPENTELYLLLFILFVFNFATFKLLSLFLPKIQIKSVVSEKSANVTDVDGAVVMPESYSRFAGIIGAVVMVTFFWALGNIVLFKIIYEPASLEKLISSVTSYFYGGATLFLPYAANQIKSALAPKM